MKYVITGATSFIGQELVTRLLEQGESVIAVCRKDSIKSKLLPESVGIIYVDMAEYSDLDSLIDQADVFIHLAWDGTNHAGRNIKETQRVNIENTVSAIKAAKRMGCSLFVESGSQAEYGSITSPISENTPCNPFSEYGKAKLAIKEKGFAMAEELGIKYLHLRIFSIYGEKDHSWTLVMTAINKMLKNERLDMSTCEQMWNFLYVEDATRQICALCSHALRSVGFVHEVFNIASTDTRKLKDFVECIREIIASTSPLVFGSITPPHVVSLNPDTSKTAAIISTRPSITFSEGIVRIVRSMKTV